MRRTLESTQVMAEEGGRPTCHPTAYELGGGLCAWALLVGLFSGSGALVLWPYPGSRGMGHWQRLRRLRSLPGSHLLSSSLLSCWKDPCSVPEVWPGLWASTHTPHPPSPGRCHFLPCVVSFGFLALPLSMEATPFFHIPPLN